MPVVKATHLGEQEEEFEVIPLWLPDEPDIVPVEPNQEPIYAPEQEPVLVPTRKE